jgi:hypothetical protein
MHKIAAGVLAVLPALAAAQGLGERNISRPVEPGEVAPYAAPRGHAGDAAEAPSLHVPPPAGSTLQDWYARQGRPTVVLFFDRRMERLPSGWDGTARVMISRDKEAEGKTETENLSIALERKEARRPLLGRSAVVRLVEHALLAELQRARIKLVDPSLVERARAGAKGDTEFDSLKGAAGYILEIELAATDGAVSMIGGLKRLAGGEIVATVRAPVEDDLHDPAAADRLAKGFIKRLLNAQPSV